MDGPDPGQDPAVLGAAGWLFDAALYQFRYPDLTDDALAASGFASGFDHYRRLGDREGRSGSLFLDPGFYLAHLPPEAAAAAAAEGCCAHFLAALAAGGEEPRTSPFFDPAWYRARYRDVAAAIDRGEWRGALHHYLANPTPTAFDPLPEFSERAYLATYPDVAEAVRAGTWRSGYQHFLHHGAAELRRPGPALDLAWYLDSDPAVRADLAAGLARDGFAHFLLFGGARGLTGVPRAARLPAPAEAAALLDARAAALLPGLARAGLDFRRAETDPPPALSVVMVLGEGFAATLATLAALRAQGADPPELILIDAGVGDETRWIDRYVAGAMLLRLGAGVPWAAAANAGLSCASAPAVLFLDPAVEAAPGALAAALRRLDQDPAIAAVGARLLAPDGGLHEAGGIVWRDGSTTAYRRGASALAPEACFVRDVDFCAAAFLLVRADPVRALGGFDADLPPGAPAADLGLRLAEAGQRVVYDPAMLGFLLGAPAVTEGAAAEAGADSAAALSARHGTRLRFRYLPDKRVEVFARAPEPAGRRVLFIEDTVPLRRLGSGFVRSVALIGAMAELGHAVTVLPLGPPASSPAAGFADLPDTVEILHDRAAEDLEDLLRDRPGFFDAIWVARTHNLDRIRDPLDRALAGAGRKPLLVLDTEAIAALREAGRARLPGREREFDLPGALAAEFRHAARCDRIVAVSEAEAAMLRALGFPAVDTIGHIRRLRLTPRPFAERAGLLFLGAMHEPGAPNHDALEWFVAEVLPLIERALRWETRLTVAGPVDPSVDLGRFASHPRISLRGPVGDPEPLYDSHRLVVAPTRFAAGLPYKLHEAASFGVPIVATELLAAQLGWDDALLAADPADPAAFAAQVVRLYRDGALWEQLRAAAAARVAAETDRDRTLAALRTILA